MGKRIYLASSWRNEEQPTAVGELRSVGHEVHDFRHPPFGPGGFSWGELDEEWHSWDKDRYRTVLLSHPRVAQGFTQDLRAMMWADTCVLLLPCGRSAHLEAGWMTGAGKHTTMFLPGELEEPDLMYLLLNEIVFTYDELFEKLD